MARTVEFNTVLERLQEAHTAMAAEAWAAQWNVEPDYQPGIRPLAVSGPEAEAALVTFVQETITPPVA